MRTTSTFVLASAMLGATIVLGDMTSEGCFASTIGMTFNVTDDFNSRGFCGGLCLKGNYATFAVQYKDCYCGQDLPPSTDVLGSDTCNIPCPGYPPETCGSTGSTSGFSVYLTGMTANAPNVNPATVTSSPKKGSATDTAKPSIVTVGGQTVVVTASSNSDKSSGPSKAGIAAGVVVGIIAIAAIVGGAFLFMRQRKRREIEEEHRRQTAVNSFIGGGKVGSSSAGSFADMRLDPAVMAQRRMSDGSIADNQDYSRRILKVTNA